MNPTGIFCPNQPRPDLAGHPENPVANHKDALKRIRQNEKRRARNRHYRSMMRSQIKAVRAAVEEGDADSAASLLPKAVSMIQRVAGKGIMHPRAAARRVSRLTVAVSKAGAAES